VQPGEIVIGGLSKPRCRRFEGLAPDPKLADAVAAGVPVIDLGGSLRESGSPPRRSGAAP
jgi:hypothetical protein